MNIQPECYPCILRQVNEAAQKVGLQEDAQHEIMHSTMQYLLESPPDISPPEVGQAIHRLVREYSGNPDPYHREKAAHNDQLLTLLPAIKSNVIRADDPLRMAVVYSIAGNVIDFGTATGPIDVEHELAQALSTSFSIDHYDLFRDSLRQAKTLLILGDNAGEIVLDRLLVETILDQYQVEITYVVRGYPVLNDVTVTDARQVGLHRVATILSNGSDAPATIMTEVSDPVREQMNTADLIIVKGQGNFESLSEISRPIYFFFKIKCQTVACFIDAPMNSYVLGLNHRVHDRKEQYEYYAT